MYKYNDDCDCGSLNYSGPAAILDANDSERKRVPKLITLIRNMTLN